MSKLRQLIRESINEYIKAIDEAGHEAGMKARMEATQEAINKRKKMTELAGLDEDVQKMIDERKVKEVNSEVKALEKSLAKLQKQFDKLKSKGNKSEESEVEEKEIVDEVAIDENEGMEYEGMGYEGMGDEGMKENESDEMYYVDVIKANTMDEETAYNWLLSQGADNIDNIIDIAFPTMNESFLHMQKLAGVITEAQYKAKKVLNEGEYSDWWAKADDELELDFNDDIYSYVDSYDEPWQGKFANEVVNIDADNYEDFKNQVKQLYDEINPF